jgi:hypothetical protein
VERRSTLGIRLNNPCNYYFLCEVLFSFRNVIFSCYNLYVGGFGYELLVIGL